MHVFRHTHEYSLLYICSDLDAGKTVTSSLMVDGCRDHDNRIDHLEHVQVFALSLLA